MLSKIKNYFTTSRSTNLVSDNPPPSLWSGARKLIGGGAIFVAQSGIQYIAKFFSPHAAEPEQYNGTLKFIVTSAGYALILEGASDIFNVIILNLYKKGAHTNKVNDQKKISELENIPDEDMVLILEQKKDIIQYHNILKLQNILRSLLGLFATLYSLNYPIQNIEDENESSSFIYSSSTIYTPPIVYTLRRSLLNFLNIPFANSISKLLFAFGVIYNARELILSLNSPRPRRGDVPLFGSINALALAGVGLSIGSITRPPVRSNVYVLGATENSGADDLALDLAISMYPSTRPSTLYHSASLVNGIASYYAYKNLTQVVYNLIRSMSLKHPKSSIEIEVIEPIPVPNRTQTGTQNAHHRANVHPPRIPNPQPLLSLYEHQRAYGGTKHKSEHRTKDLHDSSSTKQKRKTHSTSTTLSSASAASATASPYKSNVKTSDELFVIDEKSRKELLNEVNAIRRLRQVPSQRIQSAMNRLKNLFPKGNTSTIDGSEYALTWSFNDRSYRLKYEIPHGADANQFKGNKLNKVLNVMEAALLWQWDKRELDEYLAERIGGRGLEPLYYVFSERPE